MRSQWRTLSALERTLFLGCWSAAGITVVCFALLVDNQYWTGHAYLLNLASAPTGSLFGIPIVIAVLRRVSERGAAEAAELAAARAALHDAREAQATVARLNGPVPLQELSDRVSTFIERLGSLGNRPFVEKASTFQLFLSEWGSEYATFLRQLLRDMAASTDEDENLVYRFYVSADLPRGHQSRAVGPLLRSLSHSCHHVNGVRAIAGGSLRRIDPTLDEYDENPDRLNRDLADLRQQLRYGIDLDRSLDAVITAVKTYWPQLASEA